MGLISDKIVETYSNRVTSGNIRIHTPPLSPPFQVGVFLFCKGSSNSGTTLRGGDGGGKAIFSSFEVSQTSKSPFRAKCLDLFCCRL